MARATKPKALKMTAQQVKDALRTIHAPEAWGFFEEIGNTVGTNKTRTFDAFAVAFWSSLKHERRSYEVKVSRSDFKHEIDNPQKRQWALKRSNTFYFATPKGLVTLDEIPEECGLIEIDELGRPRMVKKAPWREGEPLPWNFFCEVARRASDMERNNKTLIERLRRYQREKNPFREMAYHVVQLIKDGGFYACNTCNPEPEYDKAWWQLNYFARRAKEEALHREKDQRWRIRYHREKIEEMVKVIAQKGIQIL